MFLQRNSIDMKLIITQLIILIVIGLPASINILLINIDHVQMITVARGQQLDVNFYARSCPNVVSIVTESINAASTQSNVVPPSLLRLFFHDAMVQGCDASILISSTPDNEAERDFGDNLTLRQEGFDAIDQAKAAVEEVCPGVVSCADILALATRDAVVFNGGPSWDVPLGRLDGLTSSSSAVQGRLPQANFNVQQLVDSFASIGLSASDMVLLSGAHTIGFTHCNQFTDRLYDFGGRLGATDPSLDASFARTLEGQCPQSGGDPSTVVGLDSSTPFTFDTAFFAGLESGRGVLFSDQVLFNDASTRGLVSQLASSRDAFFANFASSMIALGNVISDQPGNVRLVCSAFNGS